ncbi:metallophosphoesterase [Prolixibacteraceae bacterium Z1-6]|uniref:Metallophosphoesterase n=1 Tax=Draconibacterium aestuarii TaxID=2998507 RepID=A0A9X3F6B8_9BACT|nr:metallophosphoesterase [Prolixibacteraceae bacterium Z1-6]
MRQFIPIFILILFLGILASANIYLTKRFSWYFEIRNSRYIYITFGFLTVFMLAGIIVFTNAQSQFANLVYSAAAITMGFLLYLVLSVACVDLIRLTVKLKPFTFGILALSLAVLVSGYGVWNAIYKRVREVDITLTGLKHEIRAVQLSDIHIGHFWGPKTLQNIVEKTNALHPDVVFITGDLFDGKIRLNSASLTPLQQINAPVYFVEGNHDGYSGAKEIKKMLREIGINVLENEVTHFSEIQIIGLNHMRAGNSPRGTHRTSTKPTIQNTLEDLNIFSGQPTVLLHHSPDGIEHANKHRVDLYLAGHTHSGQIFPFNFIVPLFYKYNKGLYTWKGTQIYVSQGTGAFGPPMRVGTISEITLLNLKPE